MSRHAFDTDPERFVLGMVVFLVMLYAGLLLVNYLEPCEHGRSVLAAPCHDPNDDSHGS